MFAAPIFGLGVTNYAVYFGTYYDGAVLSVRLHRGEETEQPEREQWEEQEGPDDPVIEIKDLTTRELFSIAINDPDLQPMGKSATFSFLLASLERSSYPCERVNVKNVVLESSQNNISVTLSIKEKKFRAPLLPSDQCMTFNHKVRRSLWKRQLVMTNAQPPGFSGFSFQPNVVQA